jgi:GNAT superfamily N-acetyltransferase
MSARLKMISIRQAKESDLDQLCDVRNNRDLFRAYLDECDGESAYFLVAEIGQSIVGFGLVYLAITKAGKSKSHLPKLSDLHVGDGYRRQGVATALVEARETLARQYGHSRIYVSIDPTESLEMTALASKLGYEPLQAEPYAVSATFHDAAGVAYEKQYLRLDYSKTLI